MGIVPDDKLRNLKDYDLVGNVAILTLPEEAGPYKYRIAEAIIRKRNNINVVLNKISKVKGDERIPEYEILAGDNAITAYRESGFTYRFDVTKVFFNRRLDFERRRIAMQSQPGENVLIPFAGVGPFVIPVAARGCRVVAVEMGRDACLWLGENARLNGVEGNIDILNADAFWIPSLLRTRFDRAVIPTPYGMDHILETLLPLVRTRGVFHFYTFKKKHQIEGLIKQFTNMGLTVEHYRHCGNVAPAVSRWAFDLIKK